PTLTAAGTVKPVFAPDSTGANVFTITTGGTGLLIPTAHPSDRTTFETGNVADGYMLPDASSALFITNSGALKKVAVGAPQSISTLIGAYVRGLLGVSGDNKKVLFHRQDFDPDTMLSDINVLDHTAMPLTPSAVVPTRTALPIGFTGSSSHVVFLDNITENGGVLKSRPTGGGATKDLVASVGALTVGTGSGVVYLANPAQVGSIEDGFTVVELGYVDAATGSKGEMFADSVPEGEFALKGKRLVYSRFASQGSGIWATTLP
ncbi:MAG TPA: hypothetical protein VM580_14175, partial [Labilithrix sp.]|nr:hypothetical protein [Labilithrix sp.]